MDNDQKFHTVRGYQILEQDRKLLTSAMEDYLEMIYRHSLVEGYMRTNTLSELLNVRAPSATKMVQKLTQLGLLDYKKYGIIFLTDKGKEIGDFLLKRHNTIQQFLKNLGVTENLLTETELIEHTISTNTLNNIEVFNQFFSSNPRIAKSFLRFLSSFEGE